MSSDSYNAPFGAAEVAELKRLFAAKSDDALALSERDRLQQLLSTSREARSLYISFMQLDASLDWRIRGRDSLQKLTAASHNGKAATMLDWTTEPCCEPPVRKNRVSYIAIGLAASLLFVAAFATWFQNHNARTNGGIEAQATAGGGEAAA